MDITFKNHAPVAAKAGGSMLNVAVTLGRLNIPVYFISEYGTDQVGVEIDDFLSANNVNTKYAYHFSDGKTGLALAFLDDNQSASYSFYKSYPDKRLAIELPPFNENDIIIFGSFYAISTEIRDTLLNLLFSAKEAGALIMYDPNFRKAHFHELEKLLPLIKENIQLADVVKGSNEDFELIFNANDPAEAYSFLNDTSKVLIYTAGKEGAYFCSGPQQFHITAKTIVPVSTVGAGDNFNAGLAFGIIINNIKTYNISKVSSGIWTKILQHGIDFSSEVCLSFDNYISENYATQYISKIKNV